MNKLVIHIGNQTIESIGCAIPKNINTIVEQKTTPSNTNLLTNYELTLYSGRKVTFTIKSDIDIPSLLGKVIRIENYGLIIE